MNNKSSEVEHFYALPQSVVHNIDNDEVRNILGSLLSSDQTKEVILYADEIDWESSKQNIALLLMLSTIGLVLSGLNPFVALFVFVTFAPLYHWRKIIGTIKYPDPLKEKERSQNE